VGAQSVNLTEVKNVLEKGGLVRLPEWPKHVALRGFVRPRLVRALRTRATGVAYLMEQEAWPYLHQEPHSSRRDWELVRDETLKHNAEAPAGTE
jgi:hypothetical protein